MHNFKLKSGFHKIYKIDKATFERTTKQKKPYYTFNEKNERVQFAVCPACDNPIQIIGLYKPIKNTPHPYGKHYRHNVLKLAYYSQQAYDFCPYSRNHIHITPRSRKAEFTEFEKSIYILMREQFDRVIYVLSKQLDIRITSAAAKRMLTTYVNGEGWMYPWATLNNLPWILGHLSWSKSLYGQPILKKSSLHNAIERQCSAARFEASEYYTDYDILVSKKGMFLDLNYCIISHNRSIIDDNLVETMEFVVTEGFGKNEKEIFRKNLTIDEAYFLNLIHLSDKKSFRNQKLLRIAKELMSDLPL